MAREVCYFQKDRHDAGNYQRSRPLSCRMAVLLLSAPGSGRSKQRPPATTTDPGGGAAGSAPHTRAVPLGPGYGSACAAARAASSRAASAMRTSLVL